MTRRYYCSCTVATVITTPSIASTATIVAITVTALITVITVTTTVVIAVACLIIGFKWAVSRGTRLSCGRRGKRCWALIRR